MTDNLCPICGAIRAKLLLTQNDLVYQAKRNALIPEATRHANNKAGFKNKPGQSHEDYVNTWNKAYLGRMESLVFERGI